MDYANDNYRLMIGDCLERMKEIPDGSVNLVLTDPPYGTTACKWDAVIEFTPMWDNVRRVLKPNGAAVFTAAQPFTSALVMSNPEIFRYELTWIKSRKCGQLNAKIRPLLGHESVLVFYDRQPTYHPYTETKNPLSGTKATPTATENYRAIKNQENYTRPAMLTKSSVLDGFDVGSDRGRHPTQKPVALMEYLIRTYTNPDETVLDFTMGSGTTGVACANTRRKFIGIERDEAYFEIARKRIVTAFDPPVADNDNQADLFA